MPRRVKGLGGCGGGADPPLEPERRQADRDRHQQPVAHALQEPEPVDENAAGDGTDDDG